MIRNAYYLVYKLLKSLVLFHIFVININLSIMKNTYKIIIAAVFLVLLIIGSIKTSKAPDVPLPYSSTIGTFPEGKVYLFTYENSKYIIVSNGSNVAVTKHE